MRFLFSLVLSFQMMAGALAAELGEKKPFSSPQYLKTVLAKVEADQFEFQTRYVVTMLEREGAKAVFKPILDQYSEKDQMTLRAWLRTEGDDRISFKEQKPGHWKTVIGKHTVTFSLEDLYEGKVKLNGEVIPTSGLPLTELERKVEILTQTKTTWVKSLLDQFLIPDAEAIPILIYLVLIGIAAVAGAAKFKDVMKKQSSVDELISTDLKQCQESIHNKKSYEETYEKAVSIAEASTGMTLRGKLLQTLSSGENDSCTQIFEYSLAASSKYSETQKQAICQKVESLSNCMNDFVLAHVKDENVRDPKEGFERFLRQGSKNHKTYRATKQ